MKQPQLTDYMNLSKELETLDMAWHRISSQSTNINQKLSDNPSSGGFAKGKVEGIMEKLLEVEAMLEQKKFECLEAIQVLEDSIDSLPPKNRVYARLRYILGFTGEVIARHMGYGTTSIDRIHRETIELIRGQQ